MLKHTIVICALLIPLCHTAAQAQPDEKGVPVEVVATASEYVSTSNTVSHPGHAFTDCSGTTSYFGQFNSFGDSGSVSGTADTRIDCTTTFSPPTQTTATTYQKVNYTIARGAQALYLLSCTQTGKASALDRIGRFNGGGIVGVLNPKDDGKHGLPTKWTDCPAFALGVKYTLTVRNASDAQLQATTGGSKTDKLEYLSSVPLSVAAPLKVEQAPSVQKNAAEERQDGQWWKAQNASYQVGFLLGYVGALNTVSQAIDPDGRNFPAFRFATYTNGQIQDELQRFYSDPSNQHIQVYRAIAWVKNKMEGSSQEELQKALEFLRKEDSK